MRRYCRPQQPPFPLVLCWLLWHGSGFGNMWFLFLLLKKGKGNTFFQQHDEKKLLLPSLHNMCMDYARGVWEGLSHEDLFRSAKGSPSLTQAMVVGVLWSTCPTNLRKLHYKVSKGLPRYRLVGICHLLLLLPRCGRCDSSGFSMLWTISFTWYIPPGFLYKQYWKINYIFSQDFLE